MRLFVDENLSPALVSVAHDRGYDATCARDRNLLGEPDPVILDFCVADDRVCATNNADDFRELIGDVELHPGWSCYRTSHETASFSSSTPPSHSSSSKRRLPAKSPAT